MSAEGPLRKGVGVVKSVVIREDLILGTFAPTAPVLICACRPTFSGMARTPQPISHPSVMMIHQSERGNCQANQDRPKSLPVTEEFSARVYTATHVLWLVYKGSHSVCGLPRKSLIHCAPERAALAEELL
jgi:hypothetical protein